MEVTPTTFLAILLTVVVSATGSPTTPSKAHCTSASLCTADPYRFIFLLLKGNMYSKSDMTAKWGYVRFYDKTPVPPTFPAGTYLQTRCEIGKEHPKYIVCQANGQWAETKYPNRNTALHPYTQASLQNHQCATVLKLDMSRIYYKLGIAHCQRNIQVVTTPPPTTPPPTVMPTATCHLDDLCKMPSFSGFQILQYLDFGRGTWSKQDYYRNPKTVRTTYSYMQGFDVLCLPGGSTKVWCTADGTWKEQNMGEYLPKTHPIRTTCRNGIIGSQYNVCKRH